MCSCPWRQPTCSTSLPHTSNCVSANSLVFLQRSSTSQYSNQYAALQLARLGCPCRFCRLHVGPLLRANPVAAQRPL